MASFGRNLKLSIDRALRDDVRRFFTEGFGAPLGQSTDGFDLFSFEGGANVGAFYVDAEKALSPAAYTHAPWLEFAVDDVAAAEQKLLAAGGTAVDFMDKSHPYLRVPGGPVFRLAKR